MLKKNASSFKRRKDKNGKDFGINSPLIKAALVLIAIAQVPLAIKATLDIYPILGTEDRSSLVRNWCQKY